jgi:tetratricopeptide (TPR) repeat protein
VRACAAPRLGDCLYESEAYPEALQCYLNALASAKKAGLPPSDLNKFKVIHLSLCVSSRCTGAANLKLTMRCAVAFSLCQILAGRAMYAAGQRDSAVQIFTVLC